MSKRNAGTDSRRPTPDAAGGLEEYLAAAQEYLARGWRVVPLHPLHKAPSQAGWPQLRLSVRELRGWARHFTFDLPARWPNLGLILGEASGGLVDVDCDCAEARAAAPSLLPATGRVFGRTSSAASHYLYVVTDGAPEKRVAFTWAEGEGGDRGHQWPAQGASGAGRGHQWLAHGDGDDGLKADGTLPGVEGEASATAPCAGPSGPRAGTATAPCAGPSGPRAEPSPTEGPREKTPDVRARPHAAMLVELRSTGCQTMAPPSWHPGGERVHWEPGTGTGQRGEVGHVTRTEVQRAVARLAAAALLARHWPAVGLRDEAALALAGMLLRADWPEEAVDTFCEAVAVAAGDEEAPKRRKAAATAKRLHAGDPVMGAPALAERLRGDGPAVVRQARVWLGMQSERGMAACASPASMPLTVVTPPHSGPFTATETHPHPMVLTDRDGLLCRVAIAEIAEEAIQWLWVGRVPLGALTLLDGDPGLGKTFVALDLAARVSMGHEMPDATPGVEGDVLLFTVEDNVATTIRPRLIAAGANLLRIWDMREVQGRDAAGQPLEVAFTIPTHLTLLERAIEQTAAKLVVIDPLTAYLAATVNVWNEHAVRDALKPLTVLAKRTGAAILALRHLNKSSGTQAIYRGANSIGFTATARSNLFVAKDPDDQEHQRILTGGKGNLSAPPPGIRYRLQALEGQHSQRVRVEWLGTCDYSADMVLRRLNESAEETSAYDDAVAFLYERLSQGEQRARDLEREAASAGISKSTFKRAKSAPRISKRFEGYGASGHWVWSLLPEPAQETIPATEDHPHEMHPSGGE